MRNVLSVTTPTDREIVISRVFNAPRPLVWDAMTRPELLKRWLCGPPGWEMTVCEEDPRVGGTFRWGWTGPDGVVMEITGIYHEIVPPERGVRTERFNEACGHEGVEQRATLVLTEQGGHATLLTLTLLYDSREARDGAAASGMEKGMGAGYDRLDDLLQTVAT